MRAWCVAACVVGFVGCSDDDGTDDDVPAACQEIVDACHEADADGVEGAAECHDVAHTEVEADYVAERDACIALCQAPPV
jgi:hypothetical protein